MSNNNARKPVKPSFTFSHSGISEDQAREIWHALRKAIKEIQNGNASQLRFEELYRNAYTLVLHRYGEMLYNGVVDCVIERLKEVHTTVAITSNDKLLEVTVGEWERHKLIMTMTRDILMYMDKQYCEHKKEMPVYNKGLLLFQRHVIRNGSVNARLKAVLLENIARERVGEVIDRVLMKNCLSMLVEVGVDSSEVYINEFEKEFLVQTTHFYQQESQDFISRNTVQDYLRKIEERLRQEDERADTYLDKHTKAKLRHVVQEQLITQYAQQLVENDTSGAVSMFDKNQSDDLSRMYRLFAKVAQPLNYLRQCMSLVIRQAGTNIVKDQENLKNPKMFVQQVLDCRNKYNYLVINSFLSDRTFARALKESLEYFINLDSRAAQYLSLYIDDLLKKGLTGISDQEVELRLNHVISIFRYLHDKDVFEDFYKQHLAARLLSGQSTNSDGEKAMIAKLKAECGHQFTSRLEGMFKDMDLSTTVMTNFERYLQSSQSRHPIVVTVLTTGFWPVPQQVACKLPPPAEAAAKAFQDYYTHIHSGRRLTWCTHMGSAELRCKFDKGRKELVVHTYQMCILMLFNKVDVLTYKQIRELTQIPDAELQRHLLSLAHPQVRVLRKLPNTKEIQDDHKFGYNNTYTSKSYRVKIKLLSISSTAPKEAEVPHAVMEARKNRVEASIVRVMKSRKSLEHNSLIAEVVKQLTSGFAVDPSFIKKRIESLIEREYLERDKDNRRVYHYLA